MHNWKIALCCCYRMELHLFTSIFEIRYPLYLYLCALSLIYMHVYMFICLYIEQILCCRHKTHRTG